MDYHPPCPLDEGFNYQGGNLFMPLPKDPLHCFQTRKAASLLIFTQCTAVTMRGRDGKCLEGQGTIRGMKLSYPAHACSPEGVPMIGILQGNKFPFLRMP